MMDKEYLIRMILNKSQECGIENPEIYMVENSSLRFNIYEESLEDYNLAEENALSLKGVYRGRMGYSYSEKLTEDMIDELIKNLIQYAENNENEEIEVIKGLDNQCKRSENNINKLSNYTEEEKIEYMKSIEREALNFDKRVSIVDNCSYEEYIETITIRNANGLKLEAVNSMGILNLSIVAKDEKDVQTGYSYLTINDLLEEYKTVLIKNAVSDGVNMLGAASIESGSYEIILRNDVAANIFSFMTPVFLGSVVQLDLSMLKGKVGQSIGVESLSIVDNPLLYGGRVYRSFDDEGTATYSKYVVQNGVMKTFLHNNKTAEKDDLKSTGNGFRVSHKSGVDVLPSNMHIEEGDNTLGEMISSMSKGILITDIQGLFAGANTVSGNFSLSSSGYLIQNGKLDRPVNQITISGNFYKLLEDIGMIGNDTTFSYPDVNYFGSPSLKIKALNIAGE